MSARTCTFLGQPRKQSCCNSLESKYESEDNHKLMCTFCGDEEEDEVVSFSARH